MTIRPTCLKKWQAFTLSRPTETPEARRGHVELSTQRDPMGVKPRLSALEGLIVDILASTGPVEREQSLIFTGAVEEIRFLSRHDYGCSLKMFFSRCEIQGIVAEGRRWVVRGYDSRSVERQDLQVPSLPGRGGNQAEGTRIHWRFRTGANAGLAS